MEKIILGMLMLRGLTVYEMKSTIDQKLSTMVSSSSGSIHTALKQLIKKKCIEFKTIDNKKIYYITDNGYLEFNKWIAQPMNPGKARNIEESKIFFMGFGEQSKSIDLIQDYINKLSEDLSILLQIKASLQGNTTEIIESNEKFILQNEWNSKGIKQNIQNQNFTKTIEDIYFYQMEVLSHGIAETEFEIKWYQDMIIRIKKGKRIYE